MRREAPVACRSMYDIVLQLKSESLAVVWGLLPKRVIEACKEQALKSSKQREFWLE